MLVVPADATSTPGTPARAEGSVFPESPSSDASPTPAATSPAESEAPIRRAVVEALAHDATMSDYAGMLAMLHARADVEFITYDDLPWAAGADDYKRTFPREWTNWRKWLSARPERRRKVYVLIQHDTDSGPVHTLEMAKLEAQFGVRSSIMTFARRRVRPGPDGIEDYDIDWDGLRSLQAQGFAVGYHCNALHLAEFDAQRAPAAFARDVEALRERGLRIDFFSAHGGAASPEGLTNSSIDYPALTGSPLRWVATRFSVRFNQYFSDGGSSRQSGLERTARLRDFIADMQPGERYRILVHPQYYRPFAVDMAPSILPPWPHRPGHRHALFGIRAGEGDFDVHLASSRPRRAGWRRFVKDVARRLIGGTRLYRILAEMHHARRRLQQVEATHGKEIGRLHAELEDLRVTTQAQLDALRAKNRELYERNVNYAQTIGELRKGLRERSQDQAGRDKIDTGH
jgi:hypothetical protein